MKKVVVGLGCSWTQGEGGYPDHIWKQYNGRVNLPMYKSRHLIPYEHEHSWVNVLCRDHLTGYTPVNLGQRGIGNRGSAKSLYLVDFDWNDVEEGIVVFMLSGFERFDFFRDSWRNEKFCGHSDIKDAGHYNFQTLWPHLGNQRVWDVYAEDIYSESGIAGEQLANIMEVQTFCKAYNFKFVLANAFDGRGRQFFEEHCGPLSNRIDWSSYIHTSRNYESFVELLVKKDQFVSEENWRHYYNAYQESPGPKQYLTNCVHPTIDGYKLIAQELREFIKQRHNI